MDGFWDFLGSYWWLVFPLGAAFGGWATSVRKWDERRRRDKIEMYRIKYADRAAAPAATPAQVSAADVERTVATHDETLHRWLDYELDAVKILEFPLMTDMREQVMVDFHRARRDAEALRPEDPAELRDPDRHDRYRAAVLELQSRFDVAEAEARRRRASSLTVDERRAVDRAKKLLAIADDPGATSAERQAAYRRATKELEGVIALPDAATDAIEQRIAGAIERGD